MESHRGYKALLEGCQELGLSKRLAKEFVRYCIVKKFNSDASDLPLSPSAQLDSLQHWVLLNTNDRRDVESLVGPIEHSTKSSFLSEKEKSLRRFVSAALNCSLYSLVRMMRFAPRPIAQGKFDPKRQDCWVISACNLKILKCNTEVES